MSRNRVRHCQNPSTFERANPVTGELVTRSAAAGPEDAIRAADAAAAAFPAWSGLGPNARRRILLKAAEVLLSKMDEFNGVMAAETGITAGIAENEVRIGADMLVEAASLTTQVGGEIIPSEHPGSLSLAVRQAAGVCVGIAPWNGPISLGVRAIAVALACGNTVILKGSERSPGTHWLIGDALREGGVPDGVINIVINAPGDAGEVVDALIAHPAVKRINFTGSTKVGKSIAETAARFVKPVMLELGGKAPFVVLDDADIDAAVNAATFAAFANQGQACMSAERIIVDNKVADAFVAKLAAKAKTLKAGKPADGAVLGSLIDENDAKRVEGLIQDAVAKGARLVAGGERRGPLMDATILDNVTSEMKIYHEESFGPAKGVVRVDGDEEALRVANDTEFGLSSAIFSRDIRRAMALASRLEAGMCHINGSSVQDEAQAPFGGVKTSGYGRFGGKFSIAEFTDLRWITIEDPQQKYPF
jgi:acyl-CoA reductase-like NAD-dependent aldehyde dehydrogenase